MPSPRRLIGKLPLQAGRCRPRLGVWLVALCAVLSAPALGRAAISANQLQRIEVHPKGHFTRVILKLAADPDYDIVALPGNRLRVRLHDTTGRLFKGLRRYSDHNIGGLVLSQRGDDLMMTFAMAPTGVGWRAIHLDGVPAINLDVGPPWQPQPLHPQQAGRDRIWSGAEKLLRDFDPPLKPEIPFIPTDRQVLKNLLNDDDQRLFMAGEAALYKGQLTAAADVFANFASRTGTPIRPLALYRFAETCYRLQRYPQALDAFREAEQLWPQFLSLNPASMFYYGDSIARSGNLPMGRQLLSRLIVSHADKQYAPVLLVRMADVLVRQGNEPVARAIYLNVAQAFKNTKATQIARMKLADSGFLQATPMNYRALAGIYRDIAERAGDFDLREEASFKAMLLAAINAPAGRALDEVISYQKGFPRGVYNAVLRDIREDLVDQSYLQGGWDKDAAGLVTLVDVNQDYLAGVLREPGFLPAVTAAYLSVGRPLDLIARYLGLLDRPWVGEVNQPYLYLQVAEQSAQLGDTVLAKKMLRGFLTRFPADPQARLVSERLAALQYQDGEFGDVRANLSWLLKKGEQARIPISYYYLGRVLWREKGYAQSAQAMEWYLAAMQGSGQKAPLLGDAYYVAAQSRQALGQYPQAIALLESGLKAVPVEQRDQFLYKLGEVNLQDGRQVQARAYFDQLSKEGKDADWRRLAAQSLQSLAVIPPSPSKKRKVK